MMGVFFQTFSTLQEWNIGVIVMDGNTFLSKDNFWVRWESESSLMANLSRRSEQTGTTARLHRQHEADLLRRGDKTVNASSGPTKASCPPKSHIVFLKTHKTASSTVQNVLYRYGESRNLTFALPWNKYHRFSYPLRFSRTFVKGFSSSRKKEFHLMCNHMRFRRSEVEKVMPNDTFYFSILRHPVPMMESCFGYFKSFSAFHRLQSLGNFFDASLGKNLSSVAKSGLLHNNLAFDFGFDNNVTAESEDLEQRASEAITTIERDFHLILISDYFDESMILLKHALCWSLEDVVSFRLNSRSEKSRRPVLADTAEKIKRWNALDWRIYQHFNATFWHKVDSLVGKENMKREVSELRALQAELASTCLKGGEAVNPSQIKEAGLKPFQYGAAVIQGYNLNPDLDPQTRTKCLNLITPELQYTYRLYNRQYKKNKSDKKALNG